MGKVKNFFSNWWEKKKLKYTDPRTIFGHIPTEKEIKRYKLRKRINYTMFFSGLAMIIAFIIVVIIQSVY